MLEGIVFLIEIYHQMSHRMVSWK